MGRPISIKRGGTLALYVNSPTPLAGLTMLAQVRDAEGNEVAAIVPILTSSSAFTALAAINPALNASGGQALIYVQDTSAWPEGLLRMDLLSQIPGGAQSISETFGIQVTHSITQLTAPPADYDPVTAP
jgi:hypothetical protein